MFVIMLAISEKDFRKFGCIFLHKRILLSTTTVMTGVMSKNFNKGGSSCIERHEVGVAWLQPRSYS